MAKLFYYSKYCALECGQLKCLTVSRKVEAIDLTDYMAWKEPPRPLTEAEIERALLTQDLSASMGPHPESNVGLDSQSSALDMPSGSPNPGSANVAAEMSYPATFAEIVELIKSGKPIPGTFDPYLRFGSGKAHNNQESSRYRTRLPKVKLARAKFQRKRNHGNKQRKLDQRLLRELKSLSSDSCDPETPIPHKRSEKTKSVARIHLHECVPGRIMRYDKCHRPLQRFESLHSSFPRDGRTCPVTLRKYFLRAKESK